jgi:PAS domain S-box-containing protein
MTFEPVVFAGLAVVAAVGIPQLWRSERSPLSIWIAGWTSTAISGLIVLIGPDAGRLALLTHPLGSLFAWLLLAGTLAFVGRPATRPLVLIGLAFGAARLALAATHGARAAYGLGLAVEPFLVLAASQVAWRSPAPPGGRRLGRLLGASLALLTVVGVAHLALLVSGAPASVPALTLWLVFGPPLFGVQVRAGTAWLQRSLERARDALGDRVRERTQELARSNASLLLEVGERAAAVAALRASEERWRTVSELSSDLSFAFRIQRDGRAEEDWVSDAVERLTGYRRDEIAGDGSLPVVHPDDRRRVRREALALVATGGEGMVRHRILRKDGSLRWIETRLRVRRDPEDGTVRVVGAARDTTEAHEAERAQARLERQMQDSQRLESLGLLSGGIAHDFNNLLTVILGNTRLALSALPEGADALHKRLVRIRAAAEHGAALTEQMLVYAGRGSHVRKAADLSGLVESMLELLRASLPTGTALRTELQAEAWAEVDETQLRQVVLNLVRNAGEALAGREGSVRMRTGLLRAGAEDLADARGALALAPGAYVFLEVSDSGVGMDEGTQRRVFEPFFTTRPAGRGLGLAAVLGIVRGHGGAIQLESEPGRGSTFRVLLPSAGQPLVATAPARESEAAAAPVNDARVLVVDDEEGVLELAREFLGRAGFDVVAAGSGREAVARLAAAPEGFDAAVVDLAMPGLPGERVAAELRAIQPALPLVLASGFSPEIAAARCLELRAARFLRKPYDAEALVGAVRGALGATA